MSATNFSGPVVSSNGFQQKVVESGSTPRFDKVPFFARVPLTKDSDGEKITLPAGATLVSITVSVTTAFDGTTPTVALGKTAGASDVLAAQEIDAVGVTSYDPLVEDADELYINLPVTSTVGAGVISVSYLV